MSTILEIDEIQSLTSAGDADLLSRFVESNDQDAFESVVMRHWRCVFGVCVSVLCSYQDAEDASQAVFLTLAAKADSLKNLPSIGGWLFRVAWYISKRSKSAKMSRQRHERTAASQNPTEVQDQHEEERNAVLREEIALLPEAYRIPITLHHLGGCSEKEVSKIIGCRLGTVSGRLSRGRKLLKLRLERRGVTGVTTSAAIAGVLSTAASSYANDAPQPLVLAQLSQSASLISNGGVLSSSTMPVRVQWLTEIGIKAKLGLGLTKIVLLLVSLLIPTAICLGVFLYILGSARTPVRPVPQQQAPQWGPVTPAANA